MWVNSAHHQAVKSVGRFAVVNATAPDGVIEGIEDGRYWLLRSACSGTRSS